MGKRLTIVLAVFALIVVPLAIYTAGYFLLGEAVFHEADGRLSEVHRVYALGWQARIFMPVARVEEALRGVAVQSHTTEEPDSNGQWHFHLYQKP